MASTPRDVPIRLMPEIDADAIEETARMAARYFLSCFARELIAGQEQSTEPDSD